MTLSAIIALIIATVIPLAVLSFIYSRDLYGTGDFTYVVTSFLWGALAFVLATQVNQATLSFLVPADTIRQFTAPISEELLKAIILIYLVRRPHFTYFVDGAIYGFSVGIGFAVFENYQYILGFQSAALSVAIGRVISTNLIHAAASAIIGIAFGLSRFERATGRVRVLFIGFSLGMLLHIGFNNLVTRVNSGLLLLYAAAIGFASFAAIWAAIKRGLEEEKSWIEETLGDADRVTSEEAAVVQRLSNVDEILIPLAKRFGDNKVEQIEHFLTLQARLGIMRKTLEKLPDEHLRNSTEKEMNVIRVEMDIARRSVGTFTMMYLRSIFPDDEDELWGHFEDVISERISAQPTPEGGGLWDKLGKTDD